MNGGILPFGQWLKQRRKSLELTREDLAQRIDCSLSLIEKIESGERRPSRQVAGLLAECLGIPTDERAAFESFARSEPQQAVTIAPDKGTAASPWRAAYRERTHLPLPLTSFVGRTQQVEEVKGLLMRERTRLVSMTGPPGIGKSRLSIEVAGLAEVAGEFEDGVFFVPLASINDPGLVLPLIARVLHIEEAAGSWALPNSGSLADTLKKHLGDKSALLVLDNFEQVIGAAASVADLLHSCRWLKALVTSREPLRVRGERRYSVPPLDLPDPGEPPASAASLQCSSVALFVERAQETNPHFELSEENLKVVAALCTRLDGLPLAIELVATSEIVSSPGSLLTLLEDRLAVQSELQDVPSRHRTLRDATRWSFDLLDPGEQKLFERLGVFAGGCTRQAAEAVCNAHGDMQKVSRGLAALTAKSLLNEQRLEGQEGQGGAREERRYTMLQTIREFALERLQDRGEAGTIRRLHAEYYLALAEGAELELDGPQQADLMAWLENEHDNLRAALDWALGDGDVELALQLSAALARFWSAVGYLSEGRRWLETALAKAGSSTSAHRAKALVGAGVLASRQGAYEQAIRFYDEALSLYRAKGDKRGTAITLSRLGASANEQGDFDKADAFYHESLTLSREIGDIASTAGTLNNLGNQEVLRGNIDQAASLYLSSLQLAREMGNKQKIATALLNLGRLAFHHQEDYQHAASYLGESLGLYRELGSKGGIAATLYQLGRAMLYQKCYSEAQSYLEESLHLCEQLEEMPGIAATRLGLGITILLQGGLIEARTLLHASLTLYREQGMKLGLIECLEALGGLASLEGRAEHAALLLGVVSSAREAMGIRTSEVHSALFDALAHARAQLSERQFRAAWESGRAMQIEEALLFASQ
jgi:predicted ATPase/transcriptional regulator with XRE-family HTH domain